MHGVSSIIDSVRAFNLNAHYFSAILKFSWRKKGYETKNSCKGGLYRIGC